MLKIRLTGIVILAVLSGFGFAGRDVVWQKTSSGIIENEIRYICVHPQNREVLFTATDRALYRSADRGRTNRAVLELSGSTKEVNYIYILPGEAEKIFAATAAGVFESTDSGLNWKKIYESRDPLEGKCYSVVADADAIYVGTARGLFYRIGNGPQWQKLGGKLGEAAVYKVARNGPWLYTATDAELYQVDSKTHNAKQIFTAGEKEAELISDEENSDAGGQWTRKIRDFAVAGPEPTIYLAATRGIFWSGNLGGDWSHLPSGGLPLDEVNALTVFNTENFQSTSHGGVAPGPVSKNTAGGFVLLAATGKGVYALEQNHWEPVYQGLETGDVRSLAADGKGTVYAATDKGLYSLSHSSQINLSSSKVSNSLQSPVSGLKFEKKEPSIQQVQSWAVQYADVHPKKIKDWYGLARKKAVFPTLSVGLNRSDTELFHWDSGANPDALLKGRDYLDWSATVSWDLGDLVWSTDFTSIDSRSKLMTELREDILDQVTRLYFERRRMQNEMVRNQGMDELAAEERQMRIAELTALIDGLTGGKFSQSLPEESAESQL